MAETIELPDGVVITETQIRTKNVSIPLDSIVSIEARPIWGFGGRINAIGNVGASVLLSIALWMSTAHVAIKVAGTALLVLLFAGGVYATIVGGRRVFVWTKERKFLLTGTARSPDALEIKEAIEDRLEELKLEQRRRESL